MFLPEKCTPIACAARFVGYNLGVEWVDVEVRYSLINYCIGGCGAACCFIKERAGLPWCEIFFCYHIR